MFSGEDWATESCSYAKETLGATMESLDKGRVGRGDRGLGAAGRGLICSEAKSSTNSERTISICGLL